MGKKDLKYQGPEDQWKPPIGGLDKRNPSSRKKTDEGYYNLDYLKSKLDKISSEARSIYRECEVKLDSYSLLITDDDELLYNAHQQAYPDDTTPGSVTFDEYKYLLENNNSNAAQYVIASYETKVRGASGSNALDISLLALYINSECTRIKGFINDYIGEVDDTSEYRTIEIFQDWTEDTEAILPQIWKALKGQVQNSIPGSELDSLNGEKAGEFQALFQYQLNILNKNIISLFSQFTKNWDAPASNFYNKNLGPAMKFRLKVGRSIMRGIDSKTFPTLSAEASGTTVGSDSNFEVALSDCIKRNTMFFDLVSRILVNIAQRDMYMKYVNQLSTKGKAVAKPFVSSQGVQQADVVTQSRILDADRSLSVSALNLYNYHSDLNGVLDDDAHPQYLLRTGNAGYPITGDIVVADGITIDGIDLDLHDHDGVNSPKIRGENLEFGSVTTQNLDLSTTATAVPSNLTINSTSQNIVGPGKILHEVNVGFVVDDSNVTGYEFEIVELD